MVLVDAWRSPNAMLMCDTLERWLVVEGSMGERACSVSVLDRLPDQVLQRLAKLKLPGRCRSSNFAAGKTN